MYDSASKGIQAEATAGLNQLVSWLPKLVFIISLSYYPFRSLFTKYLLNEYCVADYILGAVDTVLNKTKTLTS